MSFFQGPPKPDNPLALHRVLSPTCGLKVSPLCFGGISIGNEWSSLFGHNEDHNALLDTFYSLGGNFIDTSNTYCAEQSETLLGEWMESRGVRDQMVIATKFAAGYKAYDRKNIKLQSNYVGANAKSMYVSVRDSLKKLRTDYIDILYCHWWDPTVSVEELMSHLHTYIVSKQVLYLGASDMPAWVVVKANAYARANGLTPFSVYQGRWNVAYRDMEAEIIPMCKDQGMAIVSWASLGGGQLLSAEERKRRANDRGAPRGYNNQAADIAMSEKLEDMAQRKNTTVQALALAYLLHQSTFVFPIVGTQTVEHVKVLPDALKVQLSVDEIDELHAASDWKPQFPISFLFSDDYGANAKFNLRMTAEEHNHFQMATHIQAPPELRPYATWTGNKE